MLLWRDIVAPGLIDGVQTVVGTQQVEVDIVVAGTIAYLEAPAHTAVLRLAGCRVSRVVVDGTAQFAVEGTHTQTVAVVLQTHTAP